MLLGANFELKNSLFFGSIFDEVFIAKLKYKKQIQEALIKQMRIIKFLVLLPILVFTLVTSQCNETSHILQRRKRGGGKGRGYKNNKFNGGAYSLGRSASNGMSSRRKKLILRERNNERTGGSGSTNHMSNSERVNAKLVAPRSQEKGLEMESANDHNNATKQLRRYQLNKQLPRKKFNN